MKSVAAAAIVSVMPVLPAKAQTVNAVAPLWGDIDAFEGRTTPFNGDINPFWGDIDAFWGDIDAFGGGINPFWGDIDAFWGDIDAFWGDIDAFGGGVAPNWGDIDAFWGDIDAFGGGVGPLWGDIDAFWGDIDAFGGDAPETDLNRLAKMFGDLIDRSEAFWGEAVRSQTGQSFEEAFVAELLAKYGIDLSDPSTLQGFSRIERARFFFDWYDGLMSFSGRDHADHWMKTANWSPALTQIQGGGSDATIGLVDFTVAPELAFADSVTYLKGYDNSAGGHGSAVASLLVAAHDGRGLMGIAPRASVVLSNPFDDTGTASWEDVAYAVRTVINNGASVVNLSLGVPGSAFHPDWKSVYENSAIRDAFGRTVFVHAAGNEGEAQSGDIPWSFTGGADFIVVGSVGPGGVISSFSNTPGTACLVDATSGGGCAPANRLMNRFMVAPGEWILVTDNAGNLTRKSGTSFAAPIVTGAVALMHTRWPWLKAHPDEVVDILFATAVDLGDPGTDPVYGRGLINIAGAQSPLDFSAMSYFTVDRKGSLQKLSLSNKVKSSGASAAKVWGITNGYVVAFETIGDTYRDFLIPLEPGFTGTTVAYGGHNWMLQSYLFNAFEGWVSRRFDGGAPLANPFGWDVTASFAPLPFGAAPRDGELPYQTHVALAGGDGETLSIGSGRGASVLSGAALSSEGRFDHAAGGLNPVLGLASGGSYAAFATPLGDAGTRLGFGLTERSFDPLAPDPYSPEERPLYEGVDPYRALAGHVVVSTPLAGPLSISAGYTFLQETEGLLGMRSVDPGYLADAARTDAATVGLVYEAGARMRLAASATLGRTRSQNADEALLTLGRDALTASAYDVTLDLTSLFAPGDRARFSLMQPLHVESGSLDMNSVEVIDRDTGEIGVVARSFSLAGADRRFAAELSYATPVLSGRGQVAGFVRGESRPSPGVSAGAMAGASFRLAF
jgi:hypothetical protein